MQTVLLHWQQTVLYLLTFDDCQREQRFRFFGSLPSSFSLHESWSLSIVEASLRSLSTSASYCSICTESSSYSIVEKTDFDFHTIIKRLTSTVSSGLHWPGTHTARTNQLPFMSSKTPLPISIECRDQVAAQANCGKIARFKQKRNSSGSNVTRRYQLRVLKIVEHYVQKFISLLAAK